jgi:PAS domain S-box-containing protein
MTQAERQLDIGLLDALDIGLIVLGRDERVIGWNTWIAAASGISATEAQFRRLDEIFPSAPVGRLRRAVFDSLQSGATSMITHALHPLLLPLHTPAGQELWHNISVRAADQEGAPACVIQVFDITASAKRDQVLKERQNARYHAVVDSAPDAILTFDEQGLIQFANPAALRGFGYAPGELVGQPADLLLAGQREWEEIWEALVRGEPQQRPLPITAKRKDGSSSHLEVSASRWISDGRTYISAVLRDVSERHAAERALHQMNETLEQRVAERTRELDRVWHNSQDLQVVVDGKGVFKNVSPAATRLLGWLPEEMIGRPLFDFTHPDGHVGRAEKLAGAVAGPTETHLNRYRDKAGNYHWISWITTPADGLIYCYGRDVTVEVERQAELEAAQEQLRQSQKMDAMGQLTGGVAHDFNNLLTPIIGSLDRLLTRGVGSERERRLMDGALQSAERAKVLVQRLLAFARRQPLQPTAVDVGQLVSGMAELIASTAGPRIDLRMELAEDLPPALADANQLEMALLNLAVNARDAMSDAGVLTISAARASVRGPHPAKLRLGHYVRLSVRDTGAGMDEATLARAVEPFFSTKGIGKGTGLGLSMVHGLASQLKGGLTISSTPGQGTTVELWIPISSVAVEEDGQVTRSTLSTKAQGTALLVDDEDLVRLSTADMLMDLGFEVVEAQSAEEALHMLNEGLHPDLVVTDHLMPGMTGLELARDLRALRPHLPVLIVSGYAEMEGVARSFPRLTKPFRGAELAASLAKLKLDSKE